MQANNATLDNWDGHWSEFNAAAELNPAQAYRRRLIARFIASGAGRTPKRIVDLGSGQGDLAAELRRSFPAAEILGVELSAAGIAFSRAKVPAAVFLQQDLLREVDRDCPYRSWADYAVCSEVLEHLDNPGLFLRNAAAYLAPGCRLIVTVPGGPMSAFDKHIGHRRHFSPVKLRELLAVAGFEVLSVHGAGYPFFNLYRRAVILRGDKLIRDVSTRPGLFGRLASRVGMAAFGMLFTMNRSVGERGWQMVAVAQYRASGLPGLSGSTSQLERDAK